MSWAYDQAVQLLNASKLATDGASKLVRAARSRRAPRATLTPFPHGAQHSLQQLGELLFRKEPALVPQFSAALLELQVRRPFAAACATPWPGFLKPLQADPTGAVRKFLATVLDALAGSSVQLVAPCAAAAICLLRVRGEHEAW